MNVDDIEPVAAASTAAMLVQLALQVLSMRALVLAQLGLNAGAFAWALASESWMRLAGAVIFATANWVVVHVKIPQGG